MELTINQQALVYLVSAILFILGLKGLTHPATARRGNFYAMTAMLIAVVATLMSHQVTSYGFIIVGLAAGAAIGTYIAYKVKMTEMPQLVAALHSFVGLAAVLVAIATYLLHRQQPDIGVLFRLEVSLGALIGAITFTGSVIAFGKLQGVLSGAPVRFPFQHALNALLGVVSILLVIYFTMHGNVGILLLITLLALALGVSLIIPIGGADMPVVISMLNSYSGWATAATGFTLHNDLLVIVGAIIGCSGAILSYIMCKAMNRSIFNVIFGGFGSSSGDSESSTGAMAGDRRVRTAAIEDVVYWIEDTANVIIVPGYGMAVAQAQHALKELTDLLEARGVRVRFAIHPVAGRMPGHMNVLLAEAGIPYDKVLEMDEINPDFPNTDVVLVVGANDVVNPAAKMDPGSPIYGMPILEASEAKQVFFLKRSMSPGYSGVDNLLFYKENTSLVFGDAKATIEAINASLKGTSH